MSYTAKNIIIRKDLVSDPIFDWVTIERWAKEYNTPVEWIRRAIRACREAGVGIEYVEDKYLRKYDFLYSTEIEKKVDKKFRELFHCGRKFSG